MNTTCPRGHTSPTGDYCDVCGTPRPAPALRCPDGHELLPGARFCEYDGWDSESGERRNPVPAAPAPVPAAYVPVPAAYVPAAAPGPAANLPGGWQLLVIADRNRFDALREVKGDDVTELSFPAYVPERRFPLKAPQVLVGRSSRSRGIEPDIDLGGQFSDPGVSHAHAVLEAKPDGTWCLVDLGSTNGTYLNNAVDRIVPQRPVPIGDGDEIHLGAWTTLVLRADLSFSDARESFGEVREPERNLREAESDA